MNSKQAPFHSWTCCVSKALQEHKRNTLICWNFRAYHEDKYSLLQDKGAIPWGKVWCRAAPYPEPRTDKIQLLNMFHPQCFAKRKTFSTIKSKNRVTMYTHRLESAGLDHTHFIVTLMNKTIHTINTHSFVKRAFFQGPSWQSATMINTRQKLSSLEHILS